jgi:hypothetical protein
MHPLKWFRLRDDIAKQKAFEATTEVIDSKLSTFGE